MLSSVVVHVEETVCFELTGADVTPTAGLVRVPLDHRVSTARARAPFNDTVSLYKSPQSPTNVSAGANISIDGPENTISVMPQERTAGAARISDPGGAAGIATRAS